MATRILTRNLSTCPSAVGTYRDMTTVTFTGSSQIASPGSVDANGDKPWNIPSFYSERVETAVTISGQITFNAWSTTPSGFTAKLRARLYKVSGVGSPLIETLICEQDSAQIAGTSSTQYTWTVTPPVAISVGPGERFIVRLLWTPIAGSFGAGTPTGNYGEETANTQGCTWVEFTEAITFRLNENKLILRRTNLNGIGTLFDALEAQGSTAATSGVVNTVASGTEIQWTRTAGGTVLEWISGRLKPPTWQATAPTGNGMFWASESNVTANCTMRIKVFKRDVLGQETLVYTKSYSTEFSTTTATPGSQAGGTLVATPVFEDERLIIRVYIIPVGTMGGGQTCTFVYDHNVVAAAGDSFMSFLEGPSFKSESDPARVSESQMAMGGVGN
jgi:hypothetical protein